MPTVKLFSGSKTWGWATPTPSLGDFHLAEDAVQEAFIEAYPILSRVYGPVAFPGWFPQVLSSNIAID